MKKRTGLVLAGGILEIIAGTYLLIYALWALSFYLQIPNGLQIYNWEMLITSDNTTYYKIAKENDKINIISINNNSVITPNIKLTPTLK